MEAAEVILQKRIVSPRRLEEENIIYFGTGGWRAVIGEVFTLYNVRRLSQALANRLIRHNLESQGVLIGYDRRFLSDTAAEAPLSLLQAIISNILLPEAARRRLSPCHKLAKALMLWFTASTTHPMNVLKVFKSDGALLLIRAARSNASQCLRDENVLVILRWLSKRALFLIAITPTNTWMQSNLWWT